MSPELEHRLFEDYPELFPNWEHKQRYGMVWSKTFQIECEDGWFDLIHRLSAYLAEEIRKMPADQCVCGYKDTSHPTPECIGFDSDRPYAVQVKEKRGTLRFYLANSTDDMNAVIDVAEEDSASVCEACGESGAQLRQKKHRLMTRCEPCWEKEQNA